MEGRKPRKEGSKERGKEGREVRKPRKEGRKEGNKEERKEWK